MRFLCLTLCCLALPLLAARAQEAVSLLANGTFTADAKGTGWPQSFPFIPESARTEDLSKPDRARDMLGVIRKHKLNWTGFSFHPKPGPMVIQDWDYTPTPCWGVFVKAALAGQVFETRRMR